jgi:UDP-N-acetylmuramate dehydrogenase
MSRHTSFRIGGPADLYLAPATMEEAVTADRFCRDAGLPRFVLGAGANILVADRGVRGVVIDTTGLRGIEIQGEKVWAAAGEPMNDLAAATAAAGYAGLESFYAMPGAVGGSVWMNARCYERSISDLLEEVDVVTSSGSVQRIRIDRDEFSYKRSPFQSMDALILKASFRLRRGSRTDLERIMESLRADREKKGHFAYPCAGSVFKNNRDFGAPTGKLIDALGLRGRRIGGALVSEHHANIIVNDRGATARDVLALVELVEAAVRKAYGFSLERELLLVGDWQEAANGAD